MSFSRPTKEYIDHQLSISEEVNNPEMLQLPQGPRSHPSVPEEHPVNLGLLQAWFTWRQRQRTQETEQSSGPVDLDEVEDLPEMRLSRRWNETMSHGNSDTTPKIQNGGRIRYYGPEDNSTITSNHIENPERHNSRRTRNRLLVVLTIAILVMAVVTMLISAFVGKKDDPPFPNSSIIEDVLTRIPTVSPAPTWVAPTPSPPTNLHPFTEAPADSPSPIRQPSNHPSMRPTHQESQAPSVSETAISILDVEWELASTFYAQGGGGAIIAHNDDGQLIIGSPFGAEALRGFVEVIDTSNSTTNGTYEGMNGDRLGTAVDAAGSFIALGAPFHQQGTGLVRIIRKEMQWEIHGKSISSYIGWAIAVSASPARLAIGGPFSSGGGLGLQGEVSVYALSEDDSWQPLGSSLFGTTSNDRFGTALAFQNDMLVVSAPHSSQGGYVEAFVFDGNEWIANSKIHNPSTGVNEQFGVALALSQSSENGNYRIAVGVPLRDREDFTNIGQVEVYEYNGVDWLPLGAAISPPVLSTNSGFGTALVLHGDVLIVGSPGDGKGSVHMFHFNGTEWSLLRSIPGESSVSNFGSSVALANVLESKMRVVIGAVDENRRGVIHVFNAVPIQ